MDTTATTWINQQDTKHARTQQERAKYLVTSTLPQDTPHPRIWWDVLKIAKGL